MSIFLKNKNVVPERGASLFFLASPETAGHRFMKKGREQNPKSIFFYTQ